MTAVEILTELIPMVESVARTVAREYPGVDHEDLYQDMCLWVLEHGGSLKIEEEKGTRYIIYRAAHILAGQERAEQLRMTAQYNYRPADVRRILETAFGGREEWLQSFVPDDAASIKSTGTDGLDVTIDVRTAIEEMSPEDAEIIMSRYARGLVPDPNSAERKRLNRAVDRLCESINSYTRQRAEKLAITGHPGARRVITNAHAGAILGRQADGA